MGCATRPGAASVSEGGQVVTLVGGRLAHFLKRAKVPFGR